MTLFPSGVSAIEYTGELWSTTIYTCIHTTGKSPMINGTYSLLHADARKTTQTTPIKPNEVYRYRLPLRLS